MFHVGVIDDKKGNTRVSDYWSWTNPLSRVLQYVCLEASHLVYAKFVFQCCFIHTCQEMKVIRCTMCHAKSLRKLFLFNTRVSACVGFSFWLG